MSYHDYPFVGKETECQYKGDGDEHVRYKIKNYDVVDGFGFEVDAEDMVWKLKHHGPLAAAVQYGNCPELLYYDSGVLRFDDCAYEHPDHAIVIAGYVPAGEPWVSKFDTYEAKGSRWRDDEDPPGACKYEDETYWPDT